MLTYADVRKWHRHADARMAQSFCQRVRRLLMQQWSHILKKPLKGCKAPINETYLDQTRSGMRILWTEVQEGTGTSPKILLWYVSPHKKVNHYMRQIDDSLARLDRRTPLTPAISCHAPCERASAAQQDGEQVLACLETHEAHAERMSIERDENLLDPLANRPLKIWEVESGSVHRLKEEGWEPKLRLTSKEEQVTQMCLCVFCVLCFVCVYLCVVCCVCVCVCVWGCVCLFV
jgi:hypothetical protein